MTARTLRAVGPDAFPMRWHDHLRMRAASVVLGKKLWRQVSEYLYDQGSEQTSVPIDARRIGRGSSFGERRDLR